MATKYVYLFPHIWCLWLCCFIVGKCVKSTYKNNVINSTHGLIGVDPCEKTFCITNYHVDLSYTGIHERMNILV